MIGTTGRAFLGVTVGCARCHEHKFDPIEQRDYYRLQAVFAGVGRADREFEPDAQIAARLTTALGQWRRFDAGRQDKMKAALSRIAARPGISTNTYEMAAKSLA